MIEFFDSIVSFGASIAIWTVLPFFHSIAFFRLVDTKLSSAILIEIMIMDAFFLAVVGISISAFYGLKVVKI